MTSDLKAQNKENTLKLPVIFTEITPRTKPIQETYSSIDKVTDGLI